MKLSLPREKGLIVSWFMVLMAAPLLSGGFQPYGFGLILVLLPTLFVYDRLIVGLRYWSIGKTGPREVVLEKVGVPAIAILLVSVGYTVAGLVLQLLPWIPVAATVFFILLESLAFRYLKERHLFTRSISIMTIFVQFLLINSALSGTVTSFELTAFALMSAVGVLLVVNGVEKVDLYRVPGGLSKKGSYWYDLPVFGAGVALAAVLSLEVSSFYEWFIVLLTVAELGYRFGLRRLSMRASGIFSSYAEAFTLVLLLAHFYGLA